MEYGLWHAICNDPRLWINVLILVLMEYGLWPSGKSSVENFAEVVLILVLMEYGLWRCNRQRYM